MRLDLAHRHAAGVQRQDALVEAVPAPLVLGHDLRLEAALPVARHLDRHLAEVTLQHLAALAVAGVALGVADRVVLLMAQVLGHLGFQRPLHQQFGQLLEQAVLADQVFGLLVVGHQAGQQFLRYFVLAGCHRVSGSGGSFLPRARLHKI